MQKKSQQIIVLILCLAMLPNQLFGLSTIDSLLSELEYYTSPGQFRVRAEILNKLSIEYLHTNPAQALEYSSRALAVAESCDDLEYKAEAFNNIGKSHERLNNMDSALYYFNLALKIRLKLDDHDKVAMIYNNFGIAYYRLRKYGDALRNYQKALEIRQKYGRDEDAANTLNNMAILHTILLRYDRAIDCYKQSADRLVNSSDTASLAEVYNYLAAVYYKDKNFEQCKTYYQKALNLWKLMHDNEHIAETYHYLGMLYYKWEKNNEALEYYLKELKLREGILNEHDLENIHTSIGQIYFDIGNFDQAKQHYTNALDLIEDSKDSSKIARALSKLGNLYYEWKQFDKALKYYLRSLHYTNDNRDSRGKALLLNNIGMVHKHNREYAKARYFCEQSLDMKIRLGEDENIFYPLTSIAEIYLKEKSFEKSSNALVRALELARRKKQRKLVKEAYYLLYQTYKEAGDCEQALVFHTKYSALKDSLVSEQNQKILHELTLDYETEKKVAENKRLRESNNLQMILFICIGVFLLIILLVLFSRYNNKKKSNSLLSEKNRQIEQKSSDLEYTFARLQHKEKVLKEAVATKDKFFSIIAHDLKNPLHAIHLSSEILKINLDKLTREDLQKLSYQIYDASSHLRELLENLLQWSRSQSGNILFSPEHIMLADLIRQAINLLMPSAEKKNINLFDDIKAEYPVFADQNMIETIVRNLISNAIKFTPEHGTVKISVEANDYEVLVSISDTGVGIAEENIKKLFRIDVQHTTKGTGNEKGTGLGLILCNEFVNTHGGVLKVDSKVGKGSTFRFTIPKAGFEYDAEQFGIN